MSSSPLRQVYSQFTVAPPGALFDVARGDRPPYNLTMYVATPARPFLASKVQVPRPRVGSVPRPRLIARLQATGAARPVARLTLVSAPAGAGKTTLLSAWLAQSAVATAWLSLEAADNDPYRFFAYLVAALRQRYPDFGDDLNARLEADALETEEPGASVQALLPLLLAELAVLPEPTILVLDDYHVVTATTIHEALAFLLDHLPPPVHLVISTRSDPPLPLAQLRARGALVELRAVDLRFSNAEAARFLQETMGLDLDAYDVSALVARTEGWIAGLQLAAHSLRGQKDRRAFIAGFTGTHRFILDYLVAEVLAVQPAERQDFLLATAILDRLSGPLCDRLTGDENGQTLLTALERDNLFLVALDDERRWYRFHPLFADLLRHRLIQERPDDVAELHRRASAWFAEHDMTAEAIHHALAADDPARAAALIEAVVMPMLQQGQQFTVERWIESLPAAVRAARPQLLLLHAWVRLFTGKVDQYEDPLRAADAIWAAAGRSAERGQVLAFRANVARLRRNPRAAIPLAQQALDRLAPGAALQRAIANMVLGDAYVQTGAVADAESALARVSTEQGAAGNRLILLIARNRLADAAVLRGRLVVAAGIYEDVLARAGTLPLWQRVEARVGLGQICHQWNDLEKAASHLHAGLALGQETGRDVYLAGVYAALARLQQNQGDGASAGATIQEALRRAQQFEHASTQRRIAAQQARLWLLAGDVRSAERWRASAALPLHEVGDYLRETEFLTAARVWLAQAEPARALTILNALGPHAAEAGREGTLIAVGALQALAHQQAGEEEKALAALHAALQRAAPGRYVRLFVDEGAVMARLLSQLARQDVLPHYLPLLLDAFPGAQRAAAAPQSLTEPLTPRELEVLSLIAAGATNQEIAAALVIALTTAKKHVSNILGKLAVSNRTEAAARGRELDLL